MKNGKKKALVNIRPKKDINDRMDQKKYIKQYIDLGDIILYLKKEQDF